MAVYTDVTAEELYMVLDRYDIGCLRSFKGIAEGVENSNFYLSTDQSQYILTLYEKRVDKKDLPFFLGLMAHLAQTGLNCPTPVEDKSGRHLQEIAHKPAAIITFLPGYSIRRALPVHCFGVGEILAQFHEAGLSFDLKRSNTLSLDGWFSLYDSVKDTADYIFAGLCHELQQELQYLKTAWPTDLPQGIIHADLFPDNVFFLDDKVSGMIDFYFACHDILAYDLVICMNAWCFETDGSFNTTKARALFKGYQNVRPLSSQEITALPILSRGAALRFLLTRTQDWFATPGDAIVTRKDPLEYWRKLRMHRTIRTSSEYGLELE